MKPKHPWTGPLDIQAHFPVMYRIVAAVVAVSMVLSCGLLTPGGGDSSDVPADLASQISSLNQATIGTLAQAEEDTWAALRAPLREQLGPEADSTFKQLDEVRQALLTRALQDLDISQGGSKAPGLAQTVLLIPVTMLFVFGPHYVSQEDGSETKTNEYSDGSATGESKVTITKSGSQITLEIEIRSSKTAENGAVTNEAIKGRMQIQVCPDAEGRAPLSFSLAMSSETNRGENHVATQSTFDGSTDALVNDNADLTGNDLHYTSGFSGQTTSGSKTTGEFAELRTDITTGGMEPGGRPSGSGYISQVTRASSGATDSTVQYAKALGQALAIMFSFMVSAEAEKEWKNGRCVEIVVEGAEDSNVVAPGSSTPFTARVRHKFEGVELNGPIEGTLSGKESLAPQGKAEAPVHYTYLAPQETASSATAALETRSRRGVAKRTLEFRTGTTNYHPIAPQPAQWSGIVCSLEQPFSLSATSAIFSGSYDFVPSNATSGSVTFHGTFGDCEDRYSGTYIIEQYTEGEPQADIIMDVKGQMICPNGTVPYDTQLRILLEPITDPSCP